MGSACSSPEAATRAPAAADAPSGGAVRAPVEPGLLRPAVTSLLRLDSSESISEIATALTSEAFELLSPAAAALFLLDATVSGRG